MANKTYPHPVRTAANADNDNPVTLYDESDGTFAPTERARLMGWDGTGWIKVSTDTTGAVQTVGGSGGTQYAEDSVHVSGDSLTLAGVVQQTADAALSGDGDRSLLQVDGSGFLKVNVKAGGAGDGAILDGVTSTIKATVFDYASSNPLAVRLTDTAGDYVGAGAGTQYTEDAVAVADPVGTQLISRRRDTLASEVSLDGDVIAVNSTSKGELYVKHADAVAATQSGTWTVQPGNTANTTAWKVDGSSVTQPVSATSLPLPTGAATAALQTQPGVDIGDVTVNNAVGGPVPVRLSDGSAFQSIAEIDTDTTTATLNKAAFGLIVAGSGGPVAITGDAANGLDVDVTRITGTVTVAGTVTANAGTNLNTSALALDATLTGQQVVDNAGFTDGTTKLAMAGYIFDEVAGTALTENDAAAARVNANRAVVGAIEDGATRGRYATVTASNAVKVDGSAVTQPVSVSGAVDTELTTADLDTGAGTDTRAVVGLVLAASGGGVLAGSANPVPISDNAGSLTVDAPVGTPVFTRLSDGSAALVGQKVMASSLPVTIASDQSAVPVSGTFWQATQPVSGTVTANAGTGTFTAGGVAAHDAAASGNPVLSAGISIDTDDTAPPNRVNAESDATRLGTDRDGSLYVRPHGPQVWSYHEDSSSALTGASVHAAPGAGLSLYVTDIVCSTGAATALNIKFLEGAVTVLGPYYLEAVAGRGVALHFQTPKKITANTALTVTTSAAIAHSVDVTGFTAQG